MSVIIHDNTYHKDRTGRNLHIIMDFARRFRACDVHTLRQEGLTLHVHFADGSTCVTDFADPGVLADWIQARVRYGRGRWQVAA